MLQAWLLSCDGSEPSATGEPLPVMMLPASPERNSGD